jgi:anti-anti-sigma regulatory factor
MLSAMSEPQAVRLSGVASIRSIGQYHDDLCAMLSAGTDVVLDLGDIEDADLSFIQLIISAQRSAQARGLSLTLSSPAPEPILQTLERGGFIGPAPDDRRNFWLAQ